LRKKYRGNDAQDQGLSYHHFLDGKPAGKMDILLTIPSRPPTSQRPGAVSEGEAKIQNGRRLCTLDPVARLPTPTHLLFTSGMDTAGV
jgi:hypothetical protein